MSSLGQQIVELTNAVTTKQQTLADALTTLTAYLEARGNVIPIPERRDFARLLMEKKATEVVTGTQAEFRESELIGAALRVHAVRVFKRADSHSQSTAKIDQESVSADNVPYQQVHAAFLTSYQQTALDLLDAQTDYAIGVSCELLGERLEGKKWLASALSALVRATNSADEVTDLAAAIPVPPTPVTSRWRTTLLKFFRIDREELGARSVRSFQEMAQLQSDQRSSLAEMVAVGFESIGDKISARQARGLV